MADDPTPKEQAMAVLAQLFNEAEQISLDRIEEVLDDAGLLIDPVENGMYQNLKLGYMTCKYQDGQLLFQMTEMGNDYVAKMLPGVAADDEGGAA